MDFSRWKEPNEFNSRVIQHALRDTDERTLALCLFDLSEEERQIIWRNMSGAAIEMVKAKIADFARVEDDLKPTTKVAEDFFRGRLERYDAWLKENREKAQDKPPALATDTTEELRETFTGLRRYISNRVPTGWAEIDTSSAHPLLAKGIQLLAENWDPVTIQGILERMGKSLIQDEQRRIDMIIEGLDRLSSYELPQVIDEALKAYDPS